MTLTIRPSSLPSWADCARRTAARSFRPMVEDAGYTLRDLPRHVGASVGTAVHKGCEQIVDHKLLSGGDMPAADHGVDAAIAEFDRVLDEDGGTIWDATTDKRDTGQKQIGRMVRSYRFDVAPKVEPVVVEGRLEATVSEDLDIIVSGKPDLLTGIPGGIRDVKTGAVRRANAAQYGAYEMLGRSHGFDIERIVEDYLPRVSIKKPQPQAQSHEIDPIAASQEAELLIDDMVRAVTRFRDYADNGGRAPHLAFRANPQSSLCSDRFCGAWGTKWCTAHMGAK